MGSYVDWSCNGANGGSSTSCRAYRRVPTPSLSVSPAVVSSSGTANFSWQAVSGASAYYIAFRRNGVWDAGWTYAGNVTSYNFSVSGLSNDVAGQINACSSYVCSYNSNVATATIANAPNVDFTGTPTSGVAPLAVNFSSSNTGGPITSYAWDFGDGGTSTAANPSHVFNSAGTYKIKLDVSGPGGSSARQINNYIAAILPVPSAGIKANNAAGSIIIAYNSAATISWSSANASSCSVTQSGSGTTWTGTSGSQSTGNLTAARTYILACSGPGGSDNDTVIVSVEEPNLSISSFTASPNSGLAPLRDVDFTVSLGGNAVGPIQYQLDCTNNGTYEVDIINTSAPYTFYDACDYNAGGSYQASLVVTRDRAAAATTAITVGYPSSTVNITANNFEGPVVLAHGTQFTLSWSSTNASNCVASGDWNGSLATSGSAQRIIIDANRSYSITCLGSGASSADTVYVNIIPPTPGNVRVTSAAPYVAGNSISFGWNAAPATTFYRLAFYPNGAWDGQYFSPVPYANTAVAYANTAGLTQIGLSLQACNTNGCSAWAAPITSVALVAPTPQNSVPDPLNTTSNPVSGFPITLNSSTDIKYKRVPIDTQKDRVYRLQTSGIEPPPTMFIVDANNTIVSNSIRINGNTIDMKVPANTQYYIKFTGVSGSFNIGFQNFRNFPFYQGQQ